jgi:nitroreductase
MVSPGELRALLEAARWAPSSGNEQPWRFVVLPRDHPLRGALEETLTPGNAWAKRASVLIATLAKGTRAKNNEPNRWAEHDTGIATACLIVQAAAIGLVAHPMGGFDAGALARSFGVPDEYTPMAVVAVGRYDPALHDPKLEEREAKPRTRKSLSEIAFLGSFGDPVPD